MRTVKPQTNPKIPFFIFEKENKGTVRTYTTSVWPRSAHMMHSYVVYTSTMVIHLTAHSMRLQYLHAFIGIFRLWLPYSPHVFFFEEESLFITNQN